MAARALRVGYGIDLLPKPDEVCLVLDDRLPPAEREAAERARAQMAAHYRATW
jgi:hypothetical protein